MSEVEGTARQPASERRTNVLKILAGTAGGQIVAFAAAPVLSRLYGPSDFGVLTVFTTVMLVLATVASLRLEFAIPLPTAERDAYAVVHLGVISAVVTAAVGTLLLWALRGHLADAVGDSAVFTWILVAPLTASISAIFMLLNQLAVRQGRYGSIGRRNALQGASTVIAQIVLGVASLKPGGLILGLGAGQAVGTLALAGGSGLTGPAAREGRSRTVLRRVFGRYRRFALTLSAAGLLNSLGVQLPPLLIAFLYGSAAAGWLGLSQRVLWVPVLLIGNSIAQVFLGEAAERLRNGAGGLDRLFLTSTRNLSVAAVIVSLPLVLAGPPLFAFVFGDQWEQSGEIARALALAVAAQLVASPLSQTLIVLERTGLQTAWDAFRLVAVVASVVVPHALGADLMSAVWSFAVMSTATFVLSWWLSWRAVSHVS